MAAARERRIGAFSTAPRKSRSRGIGLLLGPVIASLALAGSANAQMAERSAPLARGTYAASTAKTPDLEQIPHRIVRYTNELRTAHGLRPTAVSEPLSRAAGYFADYMARNDRISHNADGSTPQARAKQHGYDFCMVAENIAYQFHSAGFETEALAQRLVEGWEKSPGHRRNMLDPDATETGAAVARSRATGRYYAVQMFGRPHSAMYAFHVANESGIAVRYQLDGKDFDLPPRVTRTHEQCRAVRLVLHGVGKEAQAGIQPGAGDRFAVVRDRQGLRLAR